MKKLNLILQEILKFVLILMFTFVWMRYFVRKFTPALTYSILIAACAYTILFFVSRKKQQKSGLKSKEKEDAKNMFLSLALAEKPIDFFTKLATKKHKVKKVTKHYLVIDHEAEKVKTVLYVDLSFDGINISRFLEIYHKTKKENATKIVIICKNVSEKNLLNFSKNFKEKIVFLDEETAYQKLYKFYDFYPEITHKTNTESRLTFKDFVEYSFNKKRAKGYIISALFLVFSSLFVRTTIYYCVVASLLVVFALISQFNYHFNPKIDNEIL